MALHRSRTVEFATQCVSWSLTHVNVAVLHLPEGSTTDKVNALVLDLAPSAQDLAVRIAGLSATRTRRN